MEKILAIDIGGTSVKIGVVEENRILEKYSTRNIFKGKQNQLVSGIKDVCENYIKKYNISKIGIGCPGEIINNTITIASNLGWQNFNVVEDFSKAFPNCQVFVENDGNAAYLAERTYGQLQEYDNCVFVTIGRGIGGTIVCKGLPQPGTHGLGSRIGHMVIKTHGRKCNCGRQGCFETYGSVYGLIRTMKDTNRKWENESERIEDSDLSGYKLAKYKTLKHPIIQKGLTQWHDDLAEGLLNLCFLVDPEIIVIAGGITESNLIDIDYIKNRLVNCGYDKCELKVSSFRGKAGLIGASLLCK